MNCRTLGLTERWGTCDHRTPGGIGLRPSDETFGPIALSRCRITASMTRETTWGANSDDSGLKNWDTSLRHAPTCRSGQATSFDRYQLNSRTEAVRLPTVAGSRKSSTAENSHGVLWACACAAKNRAGK